MKLWVLTKLTEEPICNYSEEPEYDCVDNFVIRAKNEKSARKIAALHCGDEGGEIWRDPQKSDCNQLTIDGPQCVILSDLCVH